MRFIYELISLKRVFVDGEGSQVIFRTHFCISSYEANRRKLMCRLMWNFIWVITVCQNP